MHCHNSIRAEYDLDDLGPPVFKWDGRTYVRKDFEVRTTASLIDCTAQEQTWVDFAV